MCDPNSTSARPFAQSRISFFTGATSPTSRSIISASACAGTMFAPVPPRIVPMFAVVSPRTGSFGRGRSWIVGNRASKGSIADWPRCGYAECASFPRTRTVTRSDPFAPLASLLSVGSPFTRKRLFGERLLAARAPSDPCSSPTTRRMSIRSSPD